MRYNVTHIKVHYSPRELLEFSNSHKQRSEEHVWELILRAWDNDEWNIKFDMAKFIWPLKQRF